MLNVLHPLFGDFQLDKSAMYPHNCSIFIFQTYHLIVTNSSAEVG